MAEKTLDPQDVQLTTTDVVNLIEIYVGQRDRTKDIQWKVNIALWTLLSGAIYGVLGADDPERIPAFLPWLMLLFPFLHSFWALEVSGSLERDLKLIFHLRKRLITDAEGQFEPSIGPCSRTAAWLFMQVGVTVTLTVGAIVIA